MNNQVDQILKAELAKRCERNPRYSLRAFAKALGISPANLSLVMNAKRPPSEKTIERILERLDLTVRERNRLKSKDNCSLPADAIDASIAEQICTWQCYALLSLVETKDFKPDLTWIAKRLAISIHEVRVAVEALQKAGQLDVSQKKWKAAKDIRVNNKTSTATIRNFHRQLLARAQNSMELDPVELRDISSITFAMSPENMAEAKEEIRRFRLRMSELFEERQKSTEVYNLTVQLTPATSVVMRGNNESDSNTVGRSDAQRMQPKPGRKR